MSDKESKKAHRRTKTKMSQNGLSSFDLAELGAQTKPNVSLQISRDKLAQLVSFSFIFSCFLNYSLFKYNYFFVL